MTTYLRELCEDYRNKIQDPHWVVFHSLIEEELHKTEYKLHLLQEQELCLQFQKEKISAYISPTMKCPC